MGLLAIRTALIYLSLVLAMRVMGKRQLGDLQPVELVITLLVADLAAVVIEDSDLPLWHGVVPIAVLVALELGISTLLLKCPALARLVDGHPVVLIRGGKPVRKALRRMRLSMEELQAVLRRQGVFRLEDVEYALAETDGAVSVCLYPAKQPATAADVGRCPPADGFPVLIVSDGHLSRWGLAAAGQDEGWLARTLKGAGCELRDVFLLTADQSGKTYLVTKEEAK